MVKVDADEGAVVATWFREGVYVTEADFVPTGEGEDEGVLLTVTYDRYIHCRTEKAGVAWSNVFVLVRVCVCACACLCVRVCV